MARHILVYQINDYPDNGGGTYIKYPQTKEDAIKIVNELFSSYKNDVEILCSGWLQIEYKFKPVKFATEFELETE